MTADSRQNGDFRFADFEVDVAAQELYKGGIKVHLEVQPFQVLLKLLERPGEVVTREELRQSLWADDTFVDFNNGVNQAISKIRRALGGSAASPRFVETLPRRGYRFVGRIDAPEPVQAAPRPPPPKQRRWIGYAAVGLAGILAGVFLYQFAVGPASPPPGHFERRFPPFVVPDLDFFWARDGLVEVSPDASRVAYIAGGRIGVWDLNEVAKDRRLDETEGAGQLAWSPDSEFIAFRTRTALKLVAARGAPPITLWEGGPFHINSGIISWNTGRTILFNHEDAPHNIEATAGVSTFEISRDGGIPHPVDAPPETFGFAPRFLSTARSAFLYQTGFYAFQHQLMLRNVGSEDTQVLGPGWNPWYSPSGHIVFESLRPPAGIWAMPFAVGNAATEEPFPIAERGAQLSLSNDGTMLVYSETHLDNAQLFLLNRDGTLIRPIGQPQRFIQRPDLSPDGRRVAVWAWDGPHNGDIWIHDVDRPARILLSENEGMDIQPVWSPDGTEIAFSSERPAGGGGRDLYIKFTDRNRPPELVLSGPAFPLDWSNDKRYLLLHTRPKGQKAFSLWYLELNGDRQHQAKQMRIGTANAAAFSPDGRCVTYVANRNGTPQVYVCSFPNCDEEQRVSLDGGEQVRWAKGEGGSIYYIAPNDAMMEVDVRTQPKLTVGTPRKLFTRPGFYGGPTSVNRPYDVSDDGQRFVIVKPSKVSTEKPPAIHVWQDWAAGLKDRQMD